MIQSIGALVFNSFSKLIKLLISVTVVASADASASTMSVPLKADAWVVLSFKKIPPNTVSFKDSQLNIKVSSSAGPVVHKFEPRRISGFSIRGKLLGSKKTESTDFDEDSALRFGLVGTGKQTLSGPKKWLAADWIKKLFALAPKGVGLDKIYFFNFSDRADLIGKQRAHPKSDLLHETVVARVGNDESFQVTKVVNPPIEAAAVWLSVDGDDTGSAFETVVSDIQLTSVP